LCPQEQPVKGIRSPSRHSKIGKGKRISHPREILKEGETVEVLIEGVDRDNKRISLALTETVRAAAEAEAEITAFRQQSTEVPAGMGTFADLLNKARR